MERLLLAFIGKHTVNLPVLDFGPEQLFFEFSLKLGVDQALVPQKVNQLLKSFSISVQEDFVVNHGQVVGMV